MTARMLPFAAIVLSAEHCMTLTARTSFDPPASAQIWVDTSSANEKPNP